MVLPEDLFQMLRPEMGVTLGGGNVGMPQIFLHETQGRPVFQKMGRLGVAEGMGGNFFLDAGPPDVAAYDFQGAHPGEGPAEAVGKKPSFGAFFLFD
jgi:hypothetical protein